ncbi:hypothetical protein PanWU01x14_151340 [Parasponia andersonii]|uniref:Uncharacterized protein n=1 Tax=Parasponia andersonii TaxID=3476 RepID=A0A2P5CHJ1_PARAD|nr:hypothetical protein PanWU01x14_151340 [Parasponia andersonii]
MWLLGQLAKMEGRAEEEEPRVGARRYMRVKLRIEPTTRVEKTKSSSLRPKLGREAMSPRTQELTPTISSIRTLKGNWGSAATRDLHPLRKSPIGPNDDGLSSPAPSPPLHFPLSPPLPPCPTPPPLPFPPANEISSFSGDFAIGRRERIGDRESEEEHGKDTEARGLEMRGSSKMLRW